MPTPILVILEGPNGSGKTTLRDALKDVFPKAVLFREPGGTPFGELVRDIIKGHADKLTPDTQTALLLEARVQLYQEIGRVLSHPEVPDRLVIVDRGFISTGVYQGHLRNRDYIPFAHHFYDKCVKLLPADTKVIVACCKPGQGSAHLARSEKDAVEDMFKVSREREAYAKVTRVFRLVSSLKNVEFIELPFSRQPGSAKRTGLVYRSVQRARG